MTLSSIYREQVGLYAMRFAMECHIDQRRKYINTPYTDHLAQVTGLIATIDPSPVVIATAWLHDCMEDCNITYDFLKEQFGFVVADGVYYLSDLEKGNRAERKRLSRERLSKAQGWVQNIKVCDIISNTSSIVQHDPEFAILYLKESKMLIDALTKANVCLLNIANDAILKDVKN